MDTITSLLEAIIAFGHTIFDVVFTPLSDLLVTQGNEFTEFLYTLITFGGALDFIGSLTLLSFVFSFGVVIWVILKFFIR